MKNTSLRLIVASAAISTVAFTATAATASSKPVAHTALPCAASVATTTKSPIKITFWEGMPKSIAGGTGNYGSIHALVQAFNTAYAGKIVVTDVNQAGGYGQTWSSYVSSLATHTSPNVVMFDQYNAQSAADTKSILPMQTCITNNHFSMSTYSGKIKGAYTVKGSVIGMPYSASVPVMYYNKQAFAKAGIASPPTTMAQLLTDQTKLKSTHWAFTGTKYCGTGHPTCSGTYDKGVSIKYDPWEITAWLALADKPTVNQGNGHTGQASSSMFNNTTTQGYVKDLQTIAKVGGGNNVYNPSSSNISVAYGNLFDVANNHSGITFDTTAALGSIQSLLGLFPNVTLGVAPLPTLTATNPGSVPPGGNGLFINKSNSSAAQQSASWVFTSWLESVANLAKWDYETGYLPLRSDEVAAWNTLQKSATQKAWYTVGYNELSKGKVDVNTEGPLLGPYDQVNNDISYGLQVALTSPYPSVSGALSSAATKANGDMTTYNKSVHY